MIYSNQVRTPFVVCTSAISDISLFHLLQQASTDHLQVILSLHLLGIGSFITIFCIVEYHIILLISSKDGVVILHYQNDPPKHASLW